MHILCKTDRDTERDGYIDQDVDNRVLFPLALGKPDERQKENEEDIQLDEPAEADI